MIEELKPHVRDYLVERKCSKMFHYVVDGKCIDLGCGTGRHLQYMARNGFDVCGTDIGEGTAGLYCDIKKTIYPPSFFDFAYTINVLHHLQSRKDQVLAMREAARVLRKGGLYFIHELNFRNPLIGLYVKYIFRHYRNIDQGDETWFDRKLIAQVPELKLIKTEYFTFTPDFCPKWMLPLFKKIDRWADGRWITRFGAHVMYVLEKK